MAPEPFLLVHNRRWVDIFRKHGRKRVIAAGSFFVAYRRLFSKLELPASKELRGAVFFLSHSTFWEKSTWDVDKLRGLLDEIAKNEDGLTVCVHFADVINGTAKSIFDAGYDIACAGNYFNSEFPKNFYAILTQHSAVYTNAVGSHVLYALEASLPVHWVDLPYHVTNVAYSERDWVDANKEKPIMTKVEQLLRKGDTKAPELHRLCRQELGLDSMISRSRLMAIIILSGLYWHIGLKFVKLANKMVQRTAR